MYGAYIERRVGAQRTRTEYGAPIDLQDLQRRILTYLQGNSPKSNKLPKACISCIDF